MSWDGYRDDKDRFLDEDFDDLDEEVENFTEPPRCASTDSSLSHRLSHRNSPLIAPATLRPNSAGKLEGHKRQGAKSRSPAQDRLSRPLDTTKRRTAIHGPGGLSGRRSPLASTYHPYDVRRTGLTKTPEPDIVEDPPIVRSSHLYFPSSGDTVPRQGEVHPDPISDQPDVEMQAVVPEPASHGDIRSLQQHLHEQTRTHNSEVNKIVDMLRKMEANITELKVDMSDSHKNIKKDLKAAESKFEKELTSIAMGNGRKTTSTSSRFGDDLSKGLGFPNDHRSRRRMPARFGQSNSMGTRNGSRRPFKDDDSEESSWNPDSDDNSNGNNNGNNNGNSNGHGNGDPPDDPGDAAVNDRQVAIPGNRAVSLPKIPKLKEYRHKTGQEYHWNTYRVYYCRLAGRFGWSDKDSRLNLPMYMGGVAFTTVSDIPTRQTRSCHTLDHLLDKYQDCFNPQAGEEMAVVRFEESRQKHDENLLDWFHRVTFLYQEAHPDATLRVKKICVRHYVKNLYNLGVRQFVMRNTPQTMAEALYFAQVEWACINSTQYRTFGSNNNSNSNSTNTVQGRNRNGRVSTRIQQQASEPMDISALQERDHSSLTCYACNKVGHIRPNCPNLGKGVSAIAGPNVVKKTNAKDAKDKKKPFFRAKPKSISLVDQYEHAAMELHHIESQLCDQVEADPGGTPLGPADDSENESEVSEFDGTDF